MADILYVYGKNLYVNLTNKCPCRCTFCIRSQTDHLGSAKSLWLQEDPRAEEVIEGLKQYDLSQYGELVFCGYGEPLNALETLLTVCDAVRKMGPIKIRINTNGLGDLINERPTAPLLKGRVDAVSVSLNAATAEQYCEVSRPKFGLPSFDALIQYAKDCKEYVPYVQFSIVDVLPKEDMKRCQQIADSVGVHLRIRHFNEDGE